MTTMMRPWRSAALLSGVLALSSLGCGGYFPLRWPRSELWTPSQAAPLTISLSLEDAQALPLHVEKEGVTVSAEFPDPERTAGLFHVNLLRNGVQPLFLIIHNGSNQPYRFSKAGVDGGYLPAVSAARWAQVHPAVSLARLIKWGLFFIPGLIVESVAEPTTTLDFPVLEAAAQRPPRTDHRQITAEFLRLEIADGEIGMDGTLTGVLFIRPPTLGRVIAMRLVNVQTQQPLVVEIPTPPPVYVTHRTYPNTEDAVWDAAMKGTAKMKSWRVTSSDPETGVIAVRHGLTVLGWTSAVRITITVKKLDPATLKKPDADPLGVPEELPAHLTQVTIQSTLRRADSAGSGEHSRTIEQFISVLEGRLPSAAPRPTAVPSTAQSAVPAAASDAPVRRDAAGY